jgi:predicted transcriptional regulator
MAEPAAHLVDHVLPGRVRTLGWRGYTIGMKTAVSLPDRVYREAEGYAKRTRKSRSQLYAEALAEYLARHAPDEVTETMNVVVDELGDAARDTFVQRAGRRMLRNVEW